MTSPEPIDRDALLCALVLAPSTYSRNRFFSLYQDEELRSVRRRASIVRGLVRQLVSRAVEPRIEQLADGWVRMVVDLPDLALKRTTRLLPLELSLVRYLIARARGTKADDERGSIEAALARLGPSSTGN